LDKSDIAPSLIITDVVMPEMGGEKLAEKLREQYPESRILFISGYPDSLVHGDGSLKAGRELLQKPFTPSALAKKVREVLDRPEIVQSDM
jgi:YesN/AraC family two-component response regulator